MRTAFRFLLGTFLATLLSLAGAAADTPTRDNYQGLWWNAPAASESGWGIGIAHQGDTVLATWLMYDATGKAMWLAIVAHRAGESMFAGDVVAASGSPFVTLFSDVPSAPRRVVGSGTLSFSDKDTGSLSLIVDGVRITKAITRQAFGTPPECGYETAPVFGNADNYTDLWTLGTGESGSAVDLSHQGDTIFAAWLTYDALGAPRWLATTAPRVASGVYGGKLLRITGPAFAQPFDSARVAFTEVGTATFTFAHGNVATFAYTVDGVPGVDTMARQLLSPPGATLCRKAASSTIQGRVFEAAPVPAVVCADANGNGRCDADEAQVASDASGAYSLPVPPGYRGVLLADVGGRYHMTSPSPDYSTNITPYSTLVRLTHERDFALAELMVRNELGLPPRFDIKLGAVPATGTLASTIAHSLLAAFEASVSGDDGAAGALERVVAGFPPALKDMPKMRITTKNAAPVVSKEVYVDATYALTNPAAATPTVVLNGKIRGRGNFTWMLPKKPFKVQFANDAAYAAVPDFLGMKRNRNWALLADYSDRTLMRNQLMLTLGNSALFSDGLKWTPSGVHVEVWLNGDYLGVYLLTEDVRIDPARLNIRSMGAADVDGGYLVEVDYPLDCYNDGIVSLQHVTPDEVHVCVKTPDEGSATQSQLAYIKNLLDATEGDLCDAGRIDRINPVSFADWYLLQELYKNYDAPFYSSDYMWKDTNAAAVPSDRLLNMGPLWDFDLGAGNLTLGDMSRPDGCWVSHVRIGIPNWYASIFNNDTMLDMTLARWKDKRSGLERLVSSSIASFARRLDGPQQRTFERWPLTGDLYEVNGAGTFDAQVAFLTNYLLARMQWLDKAFEDKQAFAQLCK